MSRLNPVRAGRVTAPEHWPWSSYIAVIEDKLSLPWYDPTWILTQFGVQRSSARRAYQRFVLQGIGQQSPLAAARHQLFLGNDEFIGRHQGNLQSEEITEISKAHRRALALTLLEYQTNYNDRDKAMAQAYRSGAYTVVRIAGHFGVHYLTVSRAVKRGEDGNFGKSQRGKFDVEIE